MICSECIWTLLLTVNFKSLYFKFRTPSFIFSIILEYAKKETNKQISF